MKDNHYGELAVIGMRGCEQFANQVDYYLKDWRRHGRDDKRHRQKTTDTRREGMR